MEKRKKRIRQDERRTVRYQILFTPSMAERLQTLAETNKRTVASYVESAIEEFLSKK